MKPPPHFDEKTSLPGEVLLEILKEEKWSFVEFSKKVGVSEEELWKMIRGERSFEEISKLLEDLLNIPAQFWAYLEKKGV